MDFGALQGLIFLVLAYKVGSETTWRWVYYSSLIINLLAFFLILVFYWPPGFAALHPDKKTQCQQFLDLDFVGLLLFGGGLTVFLVGIGFGGNPYPWTTATVLVPTIIGGVAVFVAFLYGRFTVLTLSQNSVLLNSSAR